VHRSQTIKDSRGFRLLERGKATLAKRSQQLFCYLCRPLQSGLFTKKDLAWIFPAKTDAKSLLEDSYEEHRVTCVPFLPTVEILVIDTFAGGSDAG
jgi:hypothetical protein